MEKYPGLTEAEVAESRKTHGSNKLTAQKKTTFWQTYWGNFDNPIIIILLVALGINVCFTFFGRVDWHECAGILLSVLLSTFVSAISEYSNENTFQKIQEEAANIQCKVFRNNELCVCPLEELVVGDMVLLQAGDLIPADGKIASGRIMADQSSLNGESKETEKYAENGEPGPAAKLIDFWNPHNLYRGTVACSGECIMRIDAVGDATTYGRMTQETQITQRESPLTIKLAKLAKSISRFGYISAILIVVLSFFQNAVMECGFDLPKMVQYFSNPATVFSDLVESVILGIIVIVVAVPEGLPLMIAIVCSLNMKKMLKANVLVRKVVGIETAGNLHILFSDKTGTITNGKLKVTEFFDAAAHSYTAFRSVPEKLRMLLELSITQNTAATRVNRKIIGGNATEKALFDFLDIPVKPQNIRKARVVPFSSKYKYSKVRLEGQQNLTLIKGAPELILRSCTSFYDKDGLIHPLNDKNALNAEIEQRACRAIRVLALAACENSKDIGDGIPEGMTLIGFVSMRDTIRKAAKNTIAELSRAGIQTVMITGDKKETAGAIAKEVGLLQDKTDLLLTSDELAAMSDEEVKAALPHLRVLARALPMDKSRLVRIAQECEMVVGMTGDGVNDAPALKYADVGFAMGSGTEVAKEAGDIVILDDNFMSIKNAVLYGRTIFHSIKKFIQFQLTINVAAVTISILGPIVGVEKPLDISQMIWTNLMIDSLAAIAFGGEPALRRYLLEKPKKREEDLIDRSMWSGIIVDGLYICFISLLLFISPRLHQLFRPHPEDIYFYTGYFTFFIFISICNAFNARADGIDIMENLSLNKQFLVVMGLISLAQIFMTYFGGAILRTAGLTLSEWCVVALLSLSIFPVEFIRKLLQGRKSSLAFRKTE